MYVEYLETIWYLTTSRFISEVNFCSFLLHCSPGWLEVSYRGYQTNFLLAEKHGRILPTSFVSQVYKEVSQHIDLLSWSILPLYVKCNGINLQDVFLILWDFTTKLERLLGFIVQCLLRGQLRCFTLYIKSWMTYLCRYMYENLSTQISLKSLWRSLCGVLLIIFEEISVPIIGLVSTATYWSKIMDNSIIS